MGRKPKYKPTNTKTSTAQKKAIEAYREKNKGKYKSVSITIEAQQMEADKKRISAAGFSLPQFWRLSVDNLPPLTDKTNNNREEATQESDK